MVYGITLKRVGHMSGFIVWASRINVGLRFWTIIAKFIFFLPPKKLRYGLTTLYYHIKILVFSTNED